MTQGPTFLVARARAAKRAVRNAEVRHRHLRADARLLLLWQLGGEPYGVAAIRIVPLDQPSGRTTAAMGDPRHRDTLFENLDRFAILFNTWYLEAPRQLVVPNRPTVALIQRLSQRLIWLEDEARTSDSLARLRMLGQILQFVTREAHRPGQALLVVLTELVGAHWVTELSAIECANLAALDAAIDPGARSVADAVLDAERLAIGPSPSKAEDGPVMEILAAMAAERRSNGAVCSQTFLVELEQLYARLFAPVEELCVRVFERERVLPESTGAAERWRVEFERVWGPGGTASKVSSGDYFPGTTAISVAHFVQAWEDAGIRLIAEEAREDRFRRAALIADGKAILGNVVSFRKPGRLTIETTSRLFLTTGEAYFLCSMRWPLAFSVVACRGREVAFDCQGAVTAELLGAFPIGGDIVLMQANPDADNSDFRLPSKVPWTHRSERESVDGADFELPAYPVELLADAELPEDADSSSLEERYP